MPLAIAKTFLYAPHISAPITSSLSYVFIKFGKNLENSIGSSLFVEFITNAVGSDFITSLANDGPERKAKFFCGIYLEKTSFKNLPLLLSMPLAATRILCSAKTKFSSSQSPTT